MSNQIAVVTGVSKGIGLSIAEMLLQNNWKVYGVSRAELKLRNKNFVWVEADLTKQNSFEKIAEKIDLLVNNAGIFLSSEGLNFSEKIYEDVFAINFKAPILLTEQLKSKLKNSIVINISSVSDRIPGEECAIYCSSKAALNIYFDCTALENPEIKFVSILPSYVNTPLLHNAYNEQPPFDDWKEIIQPEQIANLVNKIVSSPEDFESMTHIIVANEKLMSDTQNQEKLKIYKADEEIFI